MRKAGLRPKAEPNTTATFSSSSNAAAKSSSLVSLTPPADLLDAYVGWQNPAENFSLILSGKNLLDERYAFTTLAIPGVVNGKYPNERLSWRLTAKYNF